MATRCERGRLSAKVRNTTSDSLADSRVASLILEGHRRAMNKLASDLVGSPHVLIDLKRCRAEADGS